MIEGVDDAGGSNGPRPELCVMCCWSREFGWGAVWLGGGTKYSHLLEKISKSVNTAMQKYSERLLYSHTKIRWLRNCGICQCISMEREWIF